MDVNETRFQLLLGHEDWSNCSVSADGKQRLRQTWEGLSSQDSPDDGVAWDQTGSELTLQPYTFLITDSSTHNHPRLDTRRGAARDRHDNWYWIDETAQALVHKAPHIVDPAHFWSVRNGISYGIQAGTGALSTEPLISSAGLSLSGLAVTEDQYLVVGTLQPAGLLIFDLLAGGRPWQIFWPSEVPFAPFDMASMPGGGVCILDREHARYWVLDRTFNVIQQDQQDVLLAAEQVDIFQPTDDSGMVRHTSSAQAFPGGVSLLAVSSIASSTAVAIEALPDGSVLILVSDAAEAFALIYHYYFGKQLGAPVSTTALATLIEKDKQTQFCLNAHDFAFISQHSDPNNATVPDRLYIVPQKSNQVYAFNVRQDQGQLVIQPLPNYFPMRFFSGKRLVVASQQIYYDSATTWLPLVEQRRPRYNTCATLHTPLGEPRHAFDGKIPGCVWHRLMLDAYIPPETSVQIASRATDDEHELSTMHWQIEPALLQRSDGSELPFVERPIGDGNGTWEVLFQSARGRYLQLKITLLGNGRLTPRLRAMRIYYPRFSYLEQYLPAVYREDSQSASFLDRFLANFEGIYTALEGRIAAAQMLFDARTAPPEALEWLAGWLGLALNLSWNTNKQRFFIKHAMEFFRCRGTINGLLLILHLTFDTRPGGPVEDTLTDYLASRARANSIRIIERFRARYAPAALFGDPDDTASPYYEARWTPDEGGMMLLQGYIHFLQQQQGLDSSNIAAFPITAPDEPELHAAWEQFTQNTLGFIPRGVAFEQWSEQRHAAPWQRFLERRYEDIEILNRAYQSHYSSFEAIELPALLPPDGPALWDWYRFETIVIPTSTTAHQFTILLPLPKDGTALDRHRQLELARHIVEQEKPVHTLFEVKFYQAGFRLGTVRLGIDTLVDLGSRTQILAPMVLGQGYLLDTYLADREPQDLIQRDFIKHENQALLSRKQ